MTRPIAIVALSLVFILFLVGESGAQQRAYDPKTSAVGRDYVTLEVHGVLRRDGGRHVVESADPLFPQFKVKVILQRSEDKNSLLTRHLEKLEGRTVIARGGLDTRRLKEQDRTVYLHLRDIPQVTESKP